LPTDRLRSEPDIELLARMPVFGALSHSQMDRLTAASSFGEFEPKEVVVRGGAAFAERVHVLLSGTARLAALSPDGRCFSVAMISRGLMYRPPEVRIELRYDLRWEAVSRCYVGTLRLDHFLAIISSSNVEDMGRILSELFGRGGGLLGRYPGFLNLDLRRRVAIALIELSEQFSVKDARGYLLRIAFSARLIGEMIGASRPKVSLILSEFQRQGIIERDGRRIIIRADGIAELLNPRTAET
jgi:CRP/FNR family transcriptional regulator, cyclic AMP receptor protein